MSLTSPIQPPSERYLVELHVVCECDSRRFSGRIRSLNSSGALLETAEAPAVGTALRLHLPKPGSKAVLCARARVEEAVTADAVEIRFVKLSAEVQQLLEELCRRTILVAADDESYQALLKMIGDPATNSGQGAEPGLTPLEGAALVGSAPMLVGSDQRPAGILITGQGDVQSALDALQRADFQLVHRSLKLGERGRPGGRAAGSATRTALVADAYGCSNIVGSSPAIQEVIATIRMVADKNCSVLITGETGTGKELVAQAIHYQSPRAQRSLVSINCGAIPEHLLEDELFGHVKGAYTSAHSNRVGRIEQADKGTLFLDEIGTMNPDLQVKLLRVLQEREFQRLGSNTSVRVDVRVVAATNMDLLGMVKEQRFRADLFYRLNVFPIHLPALRQRREDIPTLVEYFLARYCTMYGNPVKTVDPVAMELLSEYHWPGNVRELENAVESAVILSGASVSIELQHFPAILKQLQENLPGEADLSLPEEGIDYHNVVFNIERNLLLEGLKRFGGNRSKTASFLNLKRTTLLEKMKRLKLNEGGGLNAVSE